MAKLFLTSGSSISLERGASMIEVLVSMVIVAFGLLGLLGLQARALSFQKDSVDGRAAAELASQMSDRIRANMIGFRDRNYSDDMNPPNDVPMAFAACANPAQCTPAEIAARDQARWQQEVRRRLPTAAAYLVTDDANPLGWPRFITVTIAWQEPGQSAAGGIRVDDTVCNDVRANLFAGLPMDYRCYRASLAP
jgi:type IV pilus assembly protein PilV